jgi:hypothetical protein
LTFVNGLEFLDWGFLILGHHCGLVVNILAKYSECPGNSQPFTEAKAWGRPCRKSPVGDASVIYKVKFWFNAEATVVGMASLG